MFCDPLQNEVIFRHSFYLLQNGSHCSTGNREALVLYLSGWQILFRPCRHPLPPIVNSLLPVCSVQFKLIIGVKEGTDSSACTFHRFVPNSRHSNGKSSHPTSPLLTDNPLDIHPLPPAPSSAAFHFRLRALPASVNCRPLWRETLFITMPGATSHRVRGYSATAADRIIALHKTLMHNAPGRVSPEEQKLLSPTQSALPKNTHARFHFYFLFFQLYYKRPASSVKK